MIRVTFPQPRDRRWRDWKERCRALMQPYVVPPYRRPNKIDASLYKLCKDLIFAGYQNKCAYCEGRIGAQSPGDVEHFRPKSRVRDISNKLVYVKGRQVHNGYWWLAYDPKNLLPSCIGCNRYTKKSGGKGERFPVAGFRATKPGEEAKEKPLLIHPGRSDPARHFRVDMDTGLLEGLTAKGRASIEVYGLNREILAEERLLAIDFATDSLARKKKSKVIQERINDFILGRLSYSLVWRSVRNEMRRPARPARAKRAR